MLKLNPQNIKNKGLPKKFLGNALIFDVLGLSFSIAFYMGCVWNVYEVGMAYALILDKY